MLRRSLQALAEQRDPSDLSTLDDPGVPEEAGRALERGANDGNDGTGRDRCKLPPARGRWR